MTHQLGTPPLNQPLMATHGVAHYLISDTEFIFEHGTANGHGIFFLVGFGTFFIFPYIGNNNTN